MSLNSFGHLFRFTTWGESHGPALGAVVDGCPPGVPLSEDLIQPWLDRRRPGASRHTTQRQEADAVRILSGVFEGMTTGTPISLLIENTDQRSKDYGDIAQAFRPGHADLTYHLKYGVRDYRGGGRSSARETAARVAAGGVARQVLAALAPELRITGYMVQMGPKRIDRSRFDLEEIGRNDFWCPDPVAAPEWEDYLNWLRKDDHNSVGAMIEVVATGVPAGLGAPIYGKLDSDLASAMMSINAVKGVEIGEGMAAAALTGRENADEIFLEDGGLAFGSNRAGGILGGISTGQEVVVRFAVKPTSSILSPRRSIRTDGTPTEVVTKGRHDPCVGIRAVPVGEAMMALVLADHLLLDRGQTGGVRGRIG
jgi:chorismate synthase